jgi:hypothetical protein
VNYFGGKIPGTVKLEAPDGNTYDVRVTKNMNRTILKSGWAEFVDANQIDENYSLMFQYLGNAHFVVTIFDSDGKEKAFCSAGMKTSSDMMAIPSLHQPKDQNQMDAQRKAHAIIVNQQRWLHYLILLLRNFQVKPCCQIKSVAHLPLFSYMYSQFFL